VRHVLRPYLSLWLDSYKLWSSSLFGVLEPSVISSLLGPNILLNTLFYHKMYTGEHILS
jgi:hypothetical protein